jgi:glycosyltransferase involved in cell wall biosynthesis
MVRGGAESRTMEVIRHIDRSRFTFDFCTTSAEPGVFDDEIRALGGEVIPVPMGPGFPAGFLRLLRQRRYDCVHSHMHFASGLFLYLARCGGVKQRIAHFRHIHNSAEFTWVKHLRYAVMKRMLERYSTHVVAVSRGTMEHCWGAAWESDPRAQVIYNGLDLSPYEAPPDREDVRREFALPPDASLVINVAARADYHKNLGRVISIFAVLAQRDPSVSLLLAGPADRDSSLVGQVQSLGLENRVVFAGMRSDVARLLKASDLMIFPSIAEGMPGAVLEACAAGLPVVASILPGTVEIAAHFPLVKCLSLQEDDRLWADTASEWLRSERGNGVFQGTPFDQNEAVLAYERLYEAGLASPAISR